MASAVRATLARARTTTPTGLAIATKTASAALRSAAGQALAVSRAAGHVQSCRGARRTVIVIRTSLRRTVFAHQTGSAIPSATAGTTVVRVPAACEHYLYTLAGGC